MLLVVVLVFVVDFIEELGDRFLLCGVVDVGWDIG